MSEINKKYDANFTAGGLLEIEFKNLIPILLEDDFEDRLRRDVQENKYLAIPTESARKRVGAELIRRHECVPKEFWRYFENWSESEQKLGLFYLCLKTYPLVMDMHFKIAVKNHILGLKIEEYDVQMILDELASSDDEMETWSTTTIKKINTQYRKALKDAGLYEQKKGYSSLNRIPDDYWKYFEDQGDIWFKEACFL